MRNTTLKGMLAAVVCMAIPFMNVNAQTFSEGFDDITTLAGSGWAMTNASSPVGLTNWYQGTPTTATPTPGPFDAYNGALNAYIAANFNNTSGVGTISNWLMTPNRTFKNGDVLTFYTRKPSPDSYADRLEVRMSTNGASTSVGTGSAVGDYSTLLLSINPSLVLGVYPTTWTQYTITISGLPAPTSGRIAFRYFVTNGGSGANSDYIGIDQVDYTPYVCPSFTMTPSGALTGATAGAAYSTSLSQTGALGAPTYTVTAGALPPGLTLSGSGTISGTPTATGTFNFTVTVSDASGCSGSQSYSITTVCPPNPTSLILPALCDNGTPITLTQGLPAGGTYSGTGVTGSSFDPSAGTQTITYDYTDPYGCAFSTSSSLTVNTAPTVTLASFAAVCENQGAVALSGGAPAGGTYSGTGVTGSNFDPSGGTQTITYTYSDGNGCTNSDNQSIAVNAAPTVTQSGFAAVCDNGGTVTLSGGSPAGGAYSGTGVTGTSFDPSAGTQTITYSYTDANGCTGSDNQPITVNVAPTVAQSGFTAVCDNTGTVALSGGSPAGGTYSGTGVTGSNFDPSAGTQTITYTYTDGNGCTNSDSQSITVNTPPTVTLAALAAVCDNGGTVALSGGSPAGGSYSGTGVTGSDFDPSAGTQAITYSYTDANGCTGSDNQSITVNIAPAVTQSGFTAVCDAGTVALSGGSPAGGTYSGIGVTGSDFDPSVGTQTITYSYTDANGCTGSDSQSITVNGTPTVTQSGFTAVCSNAGTVALSGGSPAGGTYSGTGVTGSDFDPTSGTQAITYTYTDANGCAGTDTQTMPVNMAPVVTQAPVADLCSNNGTLALSGGAPVGGTYSGTGVTGTSFDPSAGTQTLNYAYTAANGCMSDVNFTITVNTAPVVTQSALTGVCVGAGTVTLSGGSPAGGMYSGAGVTGTSFDPAAGTQTITYAYTDANGCTNTATATMTVNELPNTMLSLPVSTMCVYNNALTLSGGTPAAGTYSGPGVSGGSFDPATAGLGAQTVTYTYTDGNGCTAAATDNILVDDCLGVEENTEMTVQAYPNPSNGHFTIALDEDQQLTDIRVMDLQGKLVEQAEMQQQGTAVTIDLTAANNGMYYLQGMLNGKQIAVRLIKQ